MCSEYDKGFAAGVEAAAQLLDRRADGHARQRADSINDREHEGAEMAARFAAEDIRALSPVRFEARVCEACGGKGNRCGGDSGGEICPPGDDDNGIACSDCPRVRCPACHGAGAVMEVTRA